MSNIFQAPTPRSYHEEKTHDHSVLPSLEGSKQIPKGIFTFEEDRLKGKTLDILINRFENLMRDLNRIPIIATKEGPSKPLIKKKKTKIEEPKPKTDRIKKKELSKTIDRIEKEAEKVEIGADKDYEDLFKQISKLIRRKNWRRRI